MNRLIVEYGVKIVLFLLLININFIAFAAKGPKLITPTNNKNVNLTTVFLKWEPIDKENIKYEVKISESPKFNDEQDLVLECYKHSVTINYPYFKIGKKYYWTVRGQYVKSGNYLINTDWSHEKLKNKEEYSFVIATDAKDKAGEKPKMSLKKDQKPYDTLQPTLKWDFYRLENETYKIANIDGMLIQPIFTDVSYDFQISSKPDFSAGTRTYSPIYNDSIAISLPILYANKKYYCRVRAKYYDPVLKVNKISKWSNEFSDCNSFETALNATGNYSFSEGSKLEQNEGRVNYSIEHIISGDYNNYSPSVSMNGQMLSFISDRFGKTELYLKKIDAHRQGGETQKTNLTHGRLLYNPFWLFDDERVGFFANLYNPTTWHIFSTNRGSGLTIMTADLEMTEKNSDFSLSGSCSTDGRVIFSAKMYEDDKYMLYLLDLSDDSRTQLRPGLFPDIRDDDRIVFCSNETGNYEIWIVELEEKSVFRPTILNSHPSDDFEPVFSPNGKRILFTSNRNGNSDIWVMDVDGSNLQQLTTNPMVDRRPQWVDDRSIVFQSNREKNSNGESVFGIYLLRLAN